ncbi:hypothetical protein ACTMTU_35930 [Streptomyces sp. OZ13]|uniref:hypothetical protein n=1 Tax=Streptomyces sp. OZ13 TaxID=3452210 RepID=UPI003F88B822
MKGYFVEGAGLTCVLVDGRLGPQVTHEGIRLIGRVPSELFEDMESYAVRHDVGLRSSPGGDLFVDGFEIDLGAQRAGDAVVIWARFPTSKVCDGSPTLSANHVAFYVGQGDNASPDGGWFRLGPEHTMVHRRGDPRSL